MSNNMNTPPTIRWQLLSTVSAFALLTSTYTASATDADRPTLWIELGGQMENISGQGEVFAPAFLAKNPTSPVLQSVTPLQAQKPPPFGFGEEGKISFRPEGSDWIFSASIRYGRSGNKRHVDHQTSGTFYEGYRSGAPVSGGALHGTDDFSDARVDHQERHAILDFQAGKDFGLGLFDRRGSSTLSVGVRFAQFASKEMLDLRARPDLGFKYHLLSYYHVTVKLPHFHTYHVTGNAAHSFRGVGPSLSWNGSLPAMGNLENGEVTFDWGANAAILFGRQKAKVQHHETAHYKTPFCDIGATHCVVTPYYMRSGGHNNDLSITVPNVGGSVGLSWRVHDFKVSMGYRADVFFGAMDTGIDAAKKSNMTFNGPYASISVGLGD